MSLVALDKKNAAHFAPYLPPEAPGYLSCGGQGLGLTDAGGEPWGAALFRTEDGTLAIDSLAAGGETARALLLDGVLAAAEEAGPAVRIRMEYEEGPENETLETLLGGCGFTVSPSPAEVLCATREALCSAPRPAKTCAGCMPLSDVPNSCLHELISGGHCPAGTPLGALKSSAWGGASSVCMGEGSVEGLVLTAPRPGGAELSLLWSRGRDASMLFSLFTMTLTAVRERLRGNQVLYLPLRDERMRKLAEFFFQGERVLKRRTAELSGQYEEDATDE
jgi:hypothetical protein